MLPSRHSHTHIVILVRKDLCLRQCQFSVTQIPNMSDEGRLPGEAQEGFLGEVHWDSFDNSIS